MKKSLRFQLTDEKVEPKHCNLMTLADFQQSCECGMFIDYDGFGNLSNGTHVAYPNILPSIMDEISIPEWATHVVWYNR